MDGAMIFVIQIGNSDNKLTQSEWSHYVHTIAHYIKVYGIETYFFSPSPGDCPWQNACWVVSVSEREKDDFEESLVSVRKSYQQDPIAVIVGDVRKI